MIRAMAKLICVLAGLYCLLALADRWVWTEPLWVKYWPLTLVSRQPSPAEVHAADLAGRLETTKREVARLHDLLSASGEKQRDLIRQLDGKTSDTEGINDLTRLQAENPVAFALVRSIDAEELRLAELRRKLADMEQEVARLEARRIAASNGVSLVDPLKSMGPADELAIPADAENVEARYERIIREAKETELAQRNEP